jgi:hypothetical protein
MENVGHKWDDYENIATRMGDLYKNVGKSVEQFKGVSDALASNGTQGINSILKNTNIVGESRKKIDSPLVYSDSDRREYTLVFQFADQGDVYKDVMQVPSELKSFSSPTIIEENGMVSATNINFPYIFSVETEPVPFIKMDYAVITALQPQYYSPYRDGMPTKCDMSITFRDMKPTYSSSFDIENLITTDSSRNRVYKDE